MKKELRGWETESKIKKGTVKKNKEIDNNKKKGRGVGDILEQSSVKCHVWNTHKNKAPQTQKPTHSKSSHKPQE